MTAPTSPRLAGIALALLFLVPLACSDSGGGPTDPSGPDPAEAVISGPDELALGCLVGVEGEFNASQSSGSIFSYSWKVDGSTAGQGLVLRYTFTELGSYTLTLEAMNQVGAVVATATKVVTVLPPTDLAGCLSQSKIMGREGVLLRTGQASVSSEYAVNTASFAQSVDNYVWTRALEGGEPTTVASGPNAHTVQITFTEGGLYDLGVEQVVGGTSVSQELPVKIYTGEPVSEPGKIVFENGPDFEGGGARSAMRAIYFMDGETGHVSGPILEEGDPLFHIGGSLTCDNERVVFTAVDDPAKRSDLWQMDHSGSRLRELVSAVGIVQDPDISSSGNIAVVDDTRWNFAKDELAIYWADASYLHASGATVDTTFNGFHPAWSPSGGRIALGNNEVSEDGEEKRRVSIYTIHPSSRSVVRETVRPPPFPHLLENEVVFNEGGNGVAWDPRGEYLAYHVIVYDTLSLDPVTLSYDHRFLIALWDVDGTEVQVLTEGMGRLSWSPNGDFLLYHRMFDNWGEPGIWQIPREGGTPVNLSAITMEGAYDHLGGFCK
jgi:hypothetical protein